MKGDLHTLKRVCSYASVVMLIGSIAFAILAVASVILGIWSFSSEDVRSMFVSLIKCGTSDLSLAAGTVEMALAFTMASFAVKIVHDMMVSIQNEHSPFTLDNAARFKALSISLLASAVVLSILEYLNRGDMILTVCLLLFLILLCVVSYCLTIVFRYGSALQKESDETL